MMFAFSPASLVKLHDVHPDLQKLAVRTLQISPLDFSILQGKRDGDEQKKLVASGKSQTTKSRHLTGHAIDFMAIVKGKGTWDPEPYHVIADAFRKTSVEMGIPITWGACWDHCLGSYTSAHAAMQDYVARRTAQGLPHFADLDHIQLDWKAYPAT